MYNSKQQYIDVDQFTCVVKLAATILGFNSFEIMSKQET
jgi:hypothetical protein